MDSSKGVAASEKEQKPAGEESEETSSEPSSTSSGMLTLSGEKCRSDDEDLETEISRWKGELKRTLAVPVLLLTTLVEMNSDGLRRFQSNLTSGHPFSFPPIPESQLENTDRQVTVDQMVKRYDHEGAVENTLKILRRRNLDDLAEKLERDHTREPNDPILGQALPISPSPVARSPSCSSSDTGPSEEEREERVLPAQRVVADTEMEELTWMETTATVQSAEDPVSNSLTPTVQSAEDPVSNSLTPTVQSTEDPVSNSLTPTVQSTEDPASNSLTPTVQSAEDPVSNSLTPTVQSAEDPVSNSLTPTVQSAEDPGPSYSYANSLTSSWQPSLELCNEFTPDILDHEGNGTYRFQCPHAGLFQCSITGLVFRMEGEGEVLYRTVHWDRRLLSQRGKRPAGPLFMFRCLKGSVSQLHLPHCQMHSGGGCDFLSVAHVTDDNMEFIPPHEITETHIIINVTGFSAYGIVHEEDAPISPIQGLVLIFYQPFVPEQRSILNVLLLPSNVVRKEVREVIERDGIREIQTTSQCKLTPKQEYTLSTYSADGHRIQPKEAEFVKCDSYENYYYPTFQLFLQTIVKEVDLLLKEKEGDELVWNRLVWLPASPTDVPSTVSAVSPAAPTANPSTPPGRAFIRRHRMSLETRLGLLQPIFLRLQDRGVLIHEEREEVVSKSTKTLQNQALLDMVVRKGSRAQEHFYQVLKEVDPCLVEDLEEQTV
ncbi:caspase recruitment domain-containing protein 8-like isoform X1 [Oncorhynchus nerka]|uniref:caspase recruitment domain-containing protein 8-like isoform X1 n=1 Tax=Oncorhynchus nerka TaxID=8023 RepID=UPI0031B7ED6A